MAEKEYIEVEPLKKQIADSKRYVRSNSTEFLIGYDTALSDVEKMISELPAADVQFVKHGRWIYENFYTHCSSCGNMAIYDKYSQEVESDYCPRCGARMDGENE